MSEVISPSVLADKQRFARLNRELREWSTRFSCGYANSWDEKAMSIIRSEMKRIEAELKGLRRLKF